MVASGLSCGCCDDGRGDIGVVGIFEVFFGLK